MLKRYRYVLYLCILLMGILYINMNKMSTPQKDMRMGSNWQISDALCCHPWGNVVLYRIEQANAKNRISMQE